MSEKNSDLYLKMINYTNSSKLQDIFNKLKNTQQQNATNITLMQETLSLLGDEYLRLEKESDDIDKKVELLRDFEQNKKRKKEEINHKYKPIIIYFRVLFICVGMLLSLAMNPLTLIICLGLYLGIEITAHVLKRKEYRKFLKELEELAAEDLEGQKKEKDDKMASINQQYTHIKELMNGKIQEQKEIENSLKQASYHFDEMQRVIDDLEQGLEESVKLTKKKSE